MSKLNQNPVGTISLYEAAKISGYHQDYLGQLCRSGKIKAVKVGRNWYTTPQALQSYFQIQTGVGQSAETATEAIDTSGLPIELFWPRPDDPDPKAFSAHAFNRQALRKLHLRSALLTTAAAAVAVVIAGGLLAVSDTFLGKPDQWAVTNFDSNPKTFQDKSVAGAVDETVVPKIEIAVPPTLKLRSESVR